METLKMLGFVYIAGVLFHFSFLSFNRAIMWPMVVLGTVIGFLSVVFNALSSVFLFISAILRIYGLSLTLATLSTK